MNIDALYKELIDSGIDKDNFSICDIPINSYDKHFLLFKNGCWHAFYYEGKGKDHLRVFSDEDSACRYFLAWMRDVFQLKAR